MVAAGLGDVNRFERFRRKLLWGLVINWVCGWESEVVRIGREGRERE